MKSFTKIFCSIVISILIAAFYVAVYNFSLESATNSAFILMILFINVFNLLEKDVIGEQDE